MSKGGLLMFLSLLSSLNIFGRSQQNSDSTMTVEQLKALMKSNSNLVILDVRNPSELVSTLGKIENVINIPIHELQSRIDELKKYKDKQIAVICRSGNRSNFGTKILRSQGFNAKNVLGGMIEYRKQESLKIK